MFYLLVALALAGCSADSATHPGADCPPVDLTDAPAVATCLFDRHIISAKDRDSALALFGVAESTADSFRALGDAVSHEQSARILRALASVTGFQSRGLFGDSARFHRIMDVVSVAIEIAEGRVPLMGAGTVRPGATPHLVWFSYPGIGVFFQPVTTVQTVAYIIPQAGMPTDSFVNIAEQMYHYALWREVAGVRFPVWEYDFTWTSGGVTNEAPWISGMNQGVVVELFAECFKRTGNPIWRDRAYEVLNSMKVNWSQGGVRLDDTTHGYWWEEFHPIVQVWNGSVNAVIGVGHLWEVTQDPEVKQMFDRGIEAIKYYTPQYDTGTWTLYSRTEGLNTVGYHNVCIAMLDVLFAQTGDQWFKDTADRWRGYTPPAGVTLRSDLGLPGIFSSPPAGT
ncbi:MAG: D-glucuronyl C5-epimerase family protein [Gemmatimonadota bacterium]